MKPFPVIPNCELFLCGGIVRDSLLGIEAKDRDFVVVTSLTFEELVKEVEKIGKVFQAKPEFFTIRCIISDEVLDLVLPRVEGSYSDGRHPDDVKRVDTLENDSNRRDFTINAMYMDKDGKVIDYHSGQLDLKNKLLRCVGKAEERFKEDGLRILRAIRFATKYKLEIVFNTYRAMFDNISMLDGVVFERIKDELNKCLLINPQVTFNYLEYFRLFPLLERKGLWFKLTNEEK